MTKQITDVKQIVGRGLMAYTQDVIAAVTEGYELDISMGKHPEFLYNGLFIANMCKYADETVDMLSVDAGVATAQDTIVEPKQKGRPSAASKAKEALAERLGNDVVASQRGKS